MKENKSGLYKENRWHLHTVDFYEFTNKDLVLFAGHVKIYIYILLKCITDEIKATVFNN